MLIMQRGGKRGATHVEKKYNDVCWGERHNVYREEKITMFELYKEIK